MAIGRARNSVVKAIVLDVRITALGVLFGRRTRRLFL
jgi:hypothetical protein